MSLIKRNRFNLPALPDFNDFFGQDFFNWGNNNFSPTRTTLPSLNVRETQDNYKIEVAAPGMEKEDFNIELDGNTLNISSSKEVKDEKEEEGYSRKEFSYQSFHRSITLPKDVADEEKIEAKYKDGILQLTIPKKEEAKQKTPKRIEIS